MSALIEKLSREMEAQDLKEKYVSINGHQQQTVLTAGNVSAHSSPKSGTNGHRHSRVNSVPGLPEAMRQQPPSAGPYRTSFSQHSPPSLNGLGQPSSPYRPAFTHSRNYSYSSSGLHRSTSLTSPPTSSSLSGSFPSRSVTIHESPSFRNQSSSTVPQNEPPPSPRETRRHSRIHSRNLSIYFPRPGSLPTSSIAEDGPQEVEFGVVSLNDDESKTPPVPRLQDPPGSKKLGEGFTFGRKMPSSKSSGFNDISANDNVTSRPIRRGHHHKHSLSHNFFSFLEPGSQLRVTPPEAASPYKSVNSQSPSTSSSPALSVQSFDFDTSIERNSTLFPIDAVIAAVLQFALGASLWISGQQNGSLACTGLGYWVVFDAFGVVLGNVIPAYLRLQSTQSPARRPYGNQRIETVLFFAQSVYLIFSSIYVCKETVEHSLLSAGDGHHHHHFYFEEEYDQSGMDFPLFLIICTILSVFSTHTLYNNHAKLLSTCGPKLPSLTSLVGHRFWSSHNGSLPVKILLNPYTALPLFFSITLLLTALLIPASQRSSLDLVIALAESVLTFSVAYPTSVVFGTVLLQTSPSRGMSNGRMESFLRAMREIERHPNVLHLPAPHIWQLTPTLAQSNIHHLHGSSGNDQLIVTMELHVRKDIDDDDVLSLTRWAHDRCKSSLHLGSRSKGEEFCQITVGIVRG